MKSLLLALALFVTSNQVFAAGTFTVRGTKAAALYNALGGNAVAAKSHSAGITLRQLKASEIECSAQTEQQSGDQGAASENLTFFICSAVGPDSDESQDYLGINAMRLMNALRAAGVKEFRTADHSGVATDSVKCTKSIEAQQGDPGAKPDLLIQYSCEIAKFSPGAYKLM